MCVARDWACVQQVAHLASLTHATIIKWERRLAAYEPQWSSPAPEGSDLTVEGDEVYTRVGENLPPL